MKRIVIVVLVLGLIGGMALAKSIKEVKTYHVTLPEQKWMERIQWLDNAKQIMAKSTLPANVVTQWSDSLTAFQNDIVAQVQKQMADTLKVKK